MNENREQEIDLIDLVLFLLEKYKSILLVTFVCMMMSYMYFNTKKDDVEVTYTITSHVDSPTLLIKCGGSFYCKSTLASEFVINKTGEAFQKKVDADGVITLVTKTPRERVDEITKALKTSGNDWVGWSNDDFVNYSHIIDSPASGDKIRGSDIFARLVLIKGKWEKEVNKNNDFIIDAPKVKTVYSLKTMILLGAMLGFVGMCVFHLFLRALKNARDNIKNKV